MTEAPAKAPRTFRIGNGQIVLGPKLWVSVVGFAAILVIGLVTSNGNLWNGALVAGSSVIGTLIGVFLQFHPVAEDHSVSALSAIRGLGRIVDSTADTNRIVGQVLASSKEPRTQSALLTVQLDLTQAGKDMQMSMVQWESVAPGALADYEADRMKGLELFKRLAEAGKETGV